jgi:hypothetical protein
MGADTGIATRLRRAGLAVREVDGWKTRANSSGLAAFDPKGGVNHHTAGHPSKSSPIPSLGILVHGRIDLPGPLCNVALGFNGVAYVIAAGPANHAGLPDAGSIRGMTGNSTAYGLEIEHDGLHALPDRLVLTAARIWAALFQRDGLAASQVVQHREWAPSRKIDLATNMSGRGADVFRELIRREIRRLKPVDDWKVSYLRNRDLKRVSARISHPDVWAEHHDQAFRRGSVEFVPIRK